MLSYSSFPQRSCIHLGCSDEVLACVHHRKPCGRTHESVAQVWQESLVIECQAAAFVGPEFLHVGILATAVGVHPTEKCPFPKPLCPHCSPGYPKHDVGPLKEHAEGVLRHSSDGSQSMLLRARAFIQFNR